jgi:hypothetical protein
MIRQTGGSAFGLISTRSTSASRAKFKRILNGGDANGFAIQTSQTNFFQTGSLR